MSCLAETLELTPAAVRKHLDELVEAGLAESSERPPFGPDIRRKGRGRPARFYWLTPAGRDRFDQAYDDLAVSALRFMAESGGDELVLDFARRRMAEFERRYAEPVAASDCSRDRVDALSSALGREGYAALVVPAVGGVQLCQNNCPVAHVAAEFPQFCEAETEAFGRLLGTHVMRLATLAHGDGVCTTHVPGVRVSASPGAGSLPGLVPDPPTDPEDDHDGQHRSA